MNNNIIQNIFVIILTIACQPLTSQTIFFTEGDQLYSLDINTCEVNQLFDTGRTFSDIAIAQNGQFYGISSNDLYTFDSLSNNVKVHEFVYGASNSLAISNDYIVYGVNRNGDLFSYNLINQKEDSILSLGIQPEGDLTFHKGNIWLSGTGDRFIKIDLETKEFSVELDFSISGAATGFTNPVSLCNGNNGYYNLSNRIDMTSRIYRLNFDENEAEEVCSILEDRITGFATKYEHLNSLKELPQINIEITRIDSADCNMPNGTIEYTLLDTAELDYEVYVNGQVINELVIDSLSEGTYHIKAISEIGCSDSISLNVPCKGTTSTIDMMEKKPLLYPNPFQRNITINSTSSNPKIQMFDINGRLINATHFRKKNGIEIAVNRNEPKGIYIVKINNMTYLVFKE